MLQCGTLSRLASSPLTSHCPSHQKREIAPCHPPSLDPSFERANEPRSTSTKPWSSGLPDTLRQILGSELPGRRGDRRLQPRALHPRRVGRASVELQVPASGLVTALEPVMRACSGTWIAHGSGSADRETVDRHDHVAVPPDESGLHAAPRVADRRGRAGLLLGFANEGLWPLCHIAFTRPIFRAADWEHYQAVNRKFADAVVAEATQRATRSCWSRTITSRCCRG